MPRARVQNCNCKQGLLRIFLVQSQSHFVSNVCQLAATAAG